jgi:hypothetical protein
MTVNPRWEESLEPKIEKARQELRRRDPSGVARDSSAVCCETEQGRAHLRLLYFGEPYTIVWPELVVRNAKDNVCVNPVQAALLEHLVLADGTPLADHWVSLRELPNGAFYERAFQGYSGNRLMRAFKNDLEGFREAAGQLSGEPLSIGDAAFRFWALPRIPLAIVYWAGDEEFPPSAQVLFDASACNYHNLEMLAHMGEMICGQLIAIYEGKQ